MKFTQKHVEQLPLDNLTIEQFLCISVETSKLLGWGFGTISETGFIAYTNNGLFLWNAEIRLKITDGVATLQSRSGGNEIIDLGKDEKTLLNFISTFKDLKKTLTPEELASKYEDLKAKFA